MSNRGLLVIVSVIGIATSVSAQVPVRFDSRRVFGCTEVKPPQQADSSRKLLVVSIPISANFDAPESSVERLRYELRMPKSFAMIDYLPKTVTAADALAQSEQHFEDSQTEVRVAYGGGAKSEFNAFGARFSLNASGERQSREFNQVKTDIQVDRLPPRKQVIVAGTDDEGQTVYFELPLHSQTTRAGQKEYAILAEVDKDWTGGIGTLVCTAKQDGRTVASMTKAIGLYLNGDSSARKRIEERLLTAQPSVDVDVLTTSVGLTLKRIPAGSFMMGTEPDDKNANEDERPQHRVTITRAFYIGVCPVTQHEYKQVMGQKNPSEFQDSTQQPVESVSWFDAVAFCNKLSEREGRKPYYRIDGQEVMVIESDGFRLPTEAQWEYACRAGSITRYCFGDDEHQLGGYAWYGEKSNGKTYPVGKKKPNTLGLYDMYGNVRQWCADYYDDKYYAGSPADDPGGPTTGLYHVCRGGCWFLNAGSCRSASRDYFASGARSYGLGFRVCCSLVPADK